MRGRVKILRGRVKKSRPHGRDVQCSFGAFAESAASLEATEPVSALPQPTAAPAPGPAGDHPGQVAQVHRVRGTDRVPPAACRVLQPLCPLLKPGPPPRLLNLTSPPSLALLPLDRSSSSDAVSRGSPFFLYVSTVAPHDAQGPGAYPQVPWVQGQPGGAGEGRDSWAAGEACAGASRLHSWLPPARRPWPRLMLLQRCPRALPFRWPAAPTGAAAVPGAIPRSQGPQGTALARRAAGRRLRAALRWDSGPRQRGAMLPSSALWRLAGTNGALPCPGHLVSDAALPTGCHPGCQTPNWGVPASADIGFTPQVRGPVGATPNGAVSLLMAPPRPTTADPAAPPAARRSATGSTSPTSTAATARGAEP